VDAGVQLAGHFGRPFLEEIFPEHRDLGGLEGQFGGELAAQGVEPRLGGGRELARRRPRLIRLDEAADLVEKRFQLERLVNEIVCAVAHPLVLVLHALVDGGHHDHGDA